MSKNRKTRKHPDENPSPGASALPVPRHRVGTAQAVVAALVILATVIIVYIPALGGAFLLDDANLVTHNRFIQDIRYAPVILGTSFGRLAETGSNYYRPAQELSYMMDYRLWGLNKTGFHLTNILIFAAAVLLIFFTANALFGDIRLSLLTALVVSVHPVYTSGVTYISGRADILSLLFVMLSLFMLSRFLASAPGAGLGSLIASAGAFFLALMAKEASIVFFIIAFLLARGTAGAHSGGSGQRSRLVLIFFAAALISYALLRMNAVKAVFHPQYYVVTRIGAAERLMMAIKAFGQYLYLLVFPINMHMQRTLGPAASRLDLSVFASLISFAGMAAIMVRARRPAGPAFLGLTWFFVWYLPVSNIFVPLNAFIAENWIQLPAIGLFLAAVYGLLRLSQGIAGRSSLRPAGYLYLVILVPVIIWYGRLAITRNLEYRDPVVFYEKAIALEPDQIKLYNGLAISYLDKDPVKAVAILKKARELDPNDISTMINLGHAYGLCGNLEEAIPLYEEILKLVPQNTLCLNNLGVYYARTGKIEKARELWETSLRINPHQPVIREYLERGR